MPDPTPTVQGSVTGSMNLAEAANALESILPDEGQQKGDETQQPEEQSDGATELENSEEDQDATEENETNEEKSEEEGETEEEDQPQTFTVKIDGKEVAVSLDELQKGYSRTQDYTRKTQQIAEIRKAVESETHAVRAEREQYSQLLGALHNQLQQSVEPQIDLERLYHEDPIEWVRQKEVLRDKQERYAAIQSEQQRLAQLSKIEQDRAMESHLHQQKDELLKVIPQWKDPKTAKAEKEMLIKSALDAGYSDEDMKGISDHRLVVLLRKAALYDNMMGKRQGIKPVVNNGPRPATPGAAGRVSTTSESSRAKQRLAKTGRIDDAAHAISLLLR